ncbi:hypothetical protein BDFB_007883, partial [Asbolus verrucosus]
IRETQFQTIRSVNVWCGILNQQVIGPHFFELDNVDLNTRAHLWFQLDGAPPHFCRIVRGYLDNAFRIRWIDRSRIHQYLATPKPGLNALRFLFVGDTETK